MPAPRPWNPSRSQNANSSANGKPEQSTLLHLEPGLWTRRVLHDPPLRLNSVASQPFNMLHFRLFHYFEHDICVLEQELHPGFDQVAKIFISNALENHYLMEELLGYSAAHMSTHAAGASREMYLNEAMRLQTRALALYNGAAQQVTEGTCLPMFLYSSLLSHHIVFDVRLHMRDDLGVAIDWMTHSIGIHRGLITLAQTTWPFLNEDLRQILTRACHRDNLPIPSSDVSGTECDGLLARLKASGLQSPILDHLCTTVEILQDRLSATQPNNTHWTWAVIQDWLVAIPAGYVELLKQRKPEALVVLSYFSVLLHRAAPHWFVADLGIRLARLIKDYLGPAWADWLKWPNVATGLVPPVQTAPSEGYGLLF